MESDGVVENASIGEDDDGILDEDIPGGEDDLLDDAELDYSEDILEEADEQRVVDDDKSSSPQDPVCIIALLNNYLGSNKCMGTGFRLFMKG